jgi:Flp pilus assembly protein TadD
MAQSPIVDDLLAQIQELAREGRRDSAEKLCRDLLRDAPRDHRAWSWLGVLTMLRGDSTDAEAAFRETVSLEPNDSQNWSNLGAALIGQKRNSEAESCFHHAVALNGSNAAHWRNLATAFVNQRRWAEAASTLRNAATLHPQDAEAWRRLAEAEQQIGRLAAAQEAYERCISLGPAELGIIVGYADVLTRRGGGKRAVELLQSVLSNSPEASSGWLALGIAWQSLGDLSQAEAAFRRAVTLDPRNAANWLNLAAVLNMQESPEAVEALRQAAMLNPHDDAAWSALGSAEHKRGNLDAAQEAFERSLAIASAGEAAIPYAAMLSERGQEWCAVEMLKDYLTRTPNSAAAWAALSNVAQRAGDMSLVETGCRRALEQASQLPVSAHSHLLHALHFCSGYDAASIVAEHRRWNE